MTTDGDPVHQVLPAVSPHRDAAQGFLVSRIKDGVDWLGQRTAVVSFFYRRRADIEGEVYNQSRIDLVLVVWWVGLIGCYAVAYYQVPYAWPVAIVLVVLRIMNITFWNLRIALIETGKTPTGAVHRDRSSSAW